MGDPRFLSAFLDKVQSQFTVVGKIWMSVLFIFRVLVLWAGVKSLWHDGRSQLLCKPSTLSSMSCWKQCYDEQFPISQVWYWIMQIISVSIPTALYLGYVVHAVHQEKKHRDRVKENMLCSYLTQVLIKIILEVAFIAGQYFLFGFFMIPEFLCNASVCTNEVECFVSRPLEKTVLVMIVSALACVSVVFSVLELLYLLCKRAFQRTSYDDSFTYC